jgi:multiple sugar transport system ATP-binding protein
MADVRFEAVRKVFGKATVVDGVDLTVADKEFVVLVGPSGCGKTTLLRCLAGLETVDGGRVHIAGRDATDLPPRARRIAMVFQSYAIFPHMTVSENIAFGLRMQRESRAVIADRVASVAKLLDIEPLLERYPSQISGGQRQRVAVARALAVKADVLLMDEPLSNLDALLRMQMRAELKALLQELGTTTIYVTHDQVEALSMGDRVAVMNSGRIAQLDSPLGVYDNPSDTYVGGFIGTPPMNFLASEITSEGGAQVIRLGDQALSLPVEVLPARPAAADVLLGIRAEAITLESSRGENLVAATVVVTEPLGSHNLVTARIGQQMLKVSTRPDLLLAPETRVWLRFDYNRIRWMDPVSGNAIGRRVAASANGAVGGIAHGGQGADVSALVSSRPGGDVVTRMR